MAERLITAEKIAAGENLQRLLHSIPPPHRANTVIWLAQSEYAKKYFDPNNVYGIMLGLPLGYNRASFIKSLLLNSALSTDFHNQLLFRLHRYLPDSPAERSEILKDSLLKGYSLSNRELLFQVAQLPESYWPDFRDQIKYNPDVFIIRQALSTNEWHNILKFCLTHPDLRFSRNAANHLSTLDHNTEEGVIFKSLFSIALKNPDKETKLNAAGSFALVSAWIFDDSAEKNKYFQMLFDSGLTAEECLNYFKSKGITQSCDESECGPIPIIAQLEEKIKKEKETAEEKAGGCSALGF